MSERKIKIQRQKERERESLFTNFFINMLISIEPCDEALIFTNYALTTIQGESESDG